MTATTEVVVAWMESKVVEEGVLYQCEAVAYIEDNFGEGFVYVNPNGSLAIGKDVLGMFKSRTASTVVWDQQGKYWRLREEGDTPGRRIGS